MNGRSVVVARRSSRSSRSREPTRETKKSRGGRARGGARARTESTHVGRSCVPASSVTFSRCLTPPCRASGASGSERRTRSWRREKGIIHSYMFWTPDVASKTSGRKKNIWFVLNTTHLRGEQLADHGAHRRAAWVVLPAMVARRARPPDSSAEEESTDVDSASVEDIARPPRAHLSLKVPRPRARQMRLWPLCFAIAIERSQRARPMIAVASASLLAGARFHLQNTDAELVSSAVIFSPLFAFAATEVAALVTPRFRVAAVHAAPRPRATRGTRRPPSPSRTARCCRLCPRRSRGSWWGAAWRGAAPRSVARDLSLFLVTYLLGVAFLLGADDAGDGDGDAGDAGDADETWQEMGGGDKRSLVRGRGRGGLD